MDTSGHKWTQVDNGMLTVDFWAAEDRGTPGLGREKEQQLAGRYSVLVTWVSFSWAEFAS